MDVQVLVNYGYLNNEEKEKFRNLSLEYIIDQVEVTESSTVSGSFRKKINLPKKHYLTHLYWNLTHDTTNIFLIIILIKIIYLIHYQELPHLLLHLMETH